FRGKAVTPYPADDDATLWLFHHVVQKYGWDWMDKYMLNKPDVIQGHLGQQRSVSSGENTVSIDSIFTITSPITRDANPVPSHSPTGDATPSRPSTGASCKKAPQRKAPRLSMRWLLDPERQATTGTWSGRGDVAPPAGYKPIFSYKVANDYRDFLTNEAQII